MKPIDWKVTATDGEARAGILTTRRSVIETPVFMPVGTQGSVKGIRFEWLEKELDARIILANTYHLFLRPGADIIREFGGLHKFTSWNRSFLTDSGGFQVFSLTDLRKLTEEGVEFRSHLDGTKHFLSPEVSMEIQAALGAEIVMAFDECPPGDAGHDATRASLEMTARWAARSKVRFDMLSEPPAVAGGLRRESEDIIKTAHPDLQPPATAGGSDLSGRLSEPPALAGGLKRESEDIIKTPHPDLQPPATTGGSDLSGRQALFGIIQGAGHLDLRKESLEKTVGIGFDGFAIGGLSVGEEKPVMYEVLNFIAPQMPKDAPRYLMGVGTPEDLIEAVNCGVDMFDCVLPTRNGRTGSAFTSRGKLNIRNAKFARDDRPLDPDCECSVCQRYSLGYLRHLYQAGEMTASILISHHNIAFFMDTMRKAREAIIVGNFGAFRREFLSRMSDNEKL